MPSDCASPDARDGFEISLRFRQLIEERVERLERDADSDEAKLPFLENRDHIRRHMHLVALQRAEASRMRRFLEISKTRFPGPMIAQ